MDNVPQKRPVDESQSQSQSNAPRSITLPKRPRSDDSAQPAVTEVSASSAVNARNISTANGDDEEDDDDDYTSSSGSSLSSSDEDDEDDDVHSEKAEDHRNTDALNGGNEKIPSLPARQKPNIRRINQQPSLLSKLSAFLPQIKSANEDLERDLAAGRVKQIQVDNEDEDDHGDGRYIEMNLGLGVLEEKSSNDERSSGEGNAGKSEAHGSSGESNVLDKLMGKETPSSGKPSIQELGE
ncbi:hypothetical protein BJX61DRAFT_506056 [Aspergillus egyptiacus]|nr:hypothetical protein BJX61DRAFT_506056 [Aspergillus egyptiacus]